MRPTRQIHVVNPRPNSTSPFLASLLSQHSVDYSLKLRQTQGEVVMIATTNPEEICCFQITSELTSLTDSLPTTQYNPISNTPNLVPHAVRLRPAAA